MTLACERAQGMKSTHGVFSGRWLRARHSVVGEVGGMAVCGGVGWVWKGAGWGGEGWAGEARW